MRFVATMLVLTLGSAGGAAGVALLAPPGGGVDRAVESDATRILGTLEPTSRRPVGEASAAARRLAGRALQPFRIAPSPRFAAVAASVGARLAIAVMALPVLFAAMLVGVLAGLLRRHRLRRRHGFASLTFSFLGKQGVAAVLSGYVFVALSPLAPPPWGLYAATVAAALGCAVYVGNLPPKL